MTTTALRPTAVGALRERVMKFAERVTTPLVPADYLDVIDPLRSSADLRGRIVAIHPETRDAVSVVIKPGRGWRGHTPGQYVRIGIDVDGVRQWRAYSLTSETFRPAGAQRPGNQSGHDGSIAITVKAIPDGKVSNHLVRRTTVGTIVQLDQAAGEFTLGEQAPSKILFLTAGSGVTPVMGMLRNMARANTDPNDVVVVHSAPTADDVIFGGELRMMARQGRIRLVEKHTDTDGMLDVAKLDELVDDFAERQTWACGPPGMLDALETRWAGDDIADRLHTERFRPTIITAGDGGQVTFSKSSTVVDAGGAETLLDAGEAAGVLMPSGCRMGICFGCVAPLRQGAVRDLRTGDVTTASAGDNVQIQTCVSAAAGSCDIDL
jgi:ferredoxin-NADP reductase